MIGSEALKSQLIGVIDKLISATKSVPDVNWKLGTEKDEFYLNLDALGFYIRKIPKNENDDYQLSVLNNMGKYLFDFVTESSDGDLFFKTNQLYQMISEKKEESASKVLENVSKIIDLRKNQDK